jgi:hypothetical protein
MHVAVWHFFFSLAFIHIPHIPQMYSARSTSNPEKLDDGRKSLAEYKKTADVLLKISSGAATSLQAAFTLGMLVLMFKHFHSVKTNSLAIERLGLPGDTSRMCRFAKIIVDNNCQSFPYKANGLMSWRSFVSLLPYLNEELPAFKGRFK